MTSLHEHRIGPYTVLWRLGITRAGTVYRAIDQYHTPVVLAVLDRGGDSESRRRFSDAIRRGWAGDGKGSRVLGADLTGPYPWAATRADGRHGAAHMLASVTGETPPGGSARSAHDPETDPPGGSASPHAPDAAPLDTPARAAHGAGIGPPGGSVSLVVARPRSALPPGDVPTPGAGRPRSRSVKSVPADEARPPGARRDASVLMATLTCLAVFLVLGVPLIASRLAGGGSPGTASTTSVAGRPGSETSGPPASRTTTPGTQPSGPRDGRVEPGLEPPEPRAWPTWPHFGSADSTHLMRNLTGVDFDVRAPDTWGCHVTARDGGTGYVRHTCGDDHRERHDVVAAPEVRLIVGDCRAPCDAANHERLRRDVPGWGRRWLAPDDNTTYIETRGEIDGEAAYGLVISRVYASDGTGVPDRHLILRSISAMDDVPTIQKLANEIREATR